MREGCRAPNSVCVYSSDQYLAVRELQQSVQVGLDIGKRQAFWHENNRAVRTLQHARQRIVVADGTFPYLHNARLREEISPDSRASAPAEISPFFAEHGDHWRIPRSEYRGRQIAAIGNQPAHGGCRANLHVSQRSHQVMQPALTWTAVGICKNEYFKFARQLFDRYPQVVHLFAATARASRDDHMDFHSRTLGYPFDNAARWI